MSITPSQRRQYPRKSLKIKIAVKSSQSQDLVYFNNKDMSLGGTFLESHDDFYEVGTEIELTFSLPDNPQPIEVRGKVAYVMTEDITTGSELVPGMGIKFLNLKEDDKKLLAACLENY